MKKITLLILCSLMLVLVGCSSTQHTAPIVDRAPAAGRFEVPRIVIKPSDTNGFYTVKKGDTLYRIALEFGQNYRDLEVWNNLANANDIKIDQVLRVLPPSVQTGGAQTSSVATTSGIEVRSLSSNTLSAPSVSTSVPNKIGPMGNKQVYSESTLADLQKPEANNFNATIAPALINSSPVEKIVDARSTPTNLEDGNIAWIWPAEGKVVATFEDGNKGIDIAGQLGQQVLAAGAGKVMYAGSGIRGYGNLVIVKHTNNLLSAYAYNKAILVKEGQIVTKGEKIAEMGNSDTDAVKLHFEIRQQGKPVDPSKYLPSR